MSAGPVPVPSLTDTRPCLWCGRSLLVGRRARGTTPTRHPRRFLPVVGLVPVTVEYLR
jgi:hypothetical protein